MRTCRAATSTSSAPSTTCPPVTSRCPGGAGDRRAGGGEPGGAGRGSGVGAGGEQGGDLPAVQHADLKVSRGEQPGCFAGALGGPRRGGPAAGPRGAVGRLADDQQHLAGEHVPLLSEAGQEGGVLQRGVLQGRVRQGGGG